MALSKKEAFSRKQQDLAAFAKAISHPARIAILKELARRNECICGEIVKALPLAQSTVSQHLKELQKAGLVRCTVEGPRNCYCINWTTFEKFSREFSSVFKQIRPAGSRTQY